MNSIADKAWPELTRDEFFDIARLRAEVFHLEQRITEPDLDEADRDERTRHLWIADPRGCAAYLRVVALDDPRQDVRRSFGRVAVRADRRGEGLARNLVARVIADYGDEPLIIHSQEYVARLYREYGFGVVGERFEEAGLPHVTMIRPALGAQCHHGINR